MNQYVKKHENPGNKVVVEVNVTDVVKYLCITGVVIVALVLASRVLTKIFTNKSIDLM